MSILAHKTAHMNHLGERLLLWCNFLLTGGLWWSGIAITFKVTLTILAGLTGVMAFFNTYSTFSKKYRTLWVVVTINHVFSYMTPKKARHRKNSISQPKEEKQPK